MTKVVGQKGPNNAHATLIKMQSAVRTSILDPRVWETAHQLIAHTEPRDEVAQATAIREWLRQNFHFVKDPEGKELLESPAYQLEWFDKHGQIEGDCDEASSLSAALLKSIGIPSEMVAVAIGPSARGFSHVFTIGYPLDPKTHRRVAVEFDVTRPPDVKSVRFSKSLKIAA